MRIRAPIFVGVALGLAAGIWVAASFHRPATPAGKMLDDFGGPIRGVVMQYASGSAFVAPVFRDYLHWQTADVTVYMACPDEAAFSEIQGLIAGATGQCKIIPVYTRHIMTPWSRDRWIAVRTDKGVALVAQKAEVAAEIWPQRQGDSALADDLARALPNVFSARRSGLFFDGGDLLSDAGKVFITHEAIDRNIQHTVETRDDLVRAFARETGCDPVLMDGAPLHHAGMYMMSAGSDPSGQRVMVVADPSLGQSLYTATPENDALFDRGPDFSPETQTRFDYVADLAQKQGYKVTRVPVVPGHGKMFMTYVNVILDQAAGQRIVYMSSYQGQDKMNAAAAQVWRTLGYEVRPVDCTTVWQSGGTLHCLVNVFSRSSE